MLEMVLKLVLLALTVVTTLSSLGILAQLAAGRRLTYDCVVDFVACSVSWALVAVFLGGA